MYDYSCQLEDSSIVCRVNGEVRQEGSIADMVFGPAELIAFTRERVAAYMVPRSVDFTAELPRLPTGKLYKHKLRERYWPAKAS